MILFGIAILSIILSILIGRTILSKLEKLFFYVGILLIVISFMPLGGYGDARLVSTTEIVCNTTFNEDVYLCDDGDEYMYLKVVGENVEFVTLGYDNVKVVEEEKCELPRIEEYVSEGKESKWFFDKEKDKVEYVIYIPEGTIKKGV